MHRNNVHRGGLFRLIVIGNFPEFVSSAFRYCQWMNFQVACYQLIARHGSKKQECLLTFSTFTMAWSYTRRRSSYQLSWKLLFPWLSVRLRTVSVDWNKRHFPAAAWNYKLLIVELFKGRTSEVKIVPIGFMTFSVSKHELCGRDYLQAAMALGC